MELLPPRPPSAASIEKSLNKKSLAKDSLDEISKKYISSPKKSASSKKEASTAVSVSKKKSKSSDLSVSKNNLAIPIPIPVPAKGDVDTSVDGKSIEEKLSELDVPPAPVVVEKKKGFFSKLFGKKEREDLSGKFENEFKKNQTPSELKTSQSDELMDVKQSLGINNSSRKIELHDMEPMSDYVSRTSWDSQIVDISKYKKSQNYNKDDLPPPFKNEIVKKESLQKKGITKEDVKRIKKEHYIKEQVAKKKELKPEVKLLTQISKPEIRELEFKKADDTIKKPVVPSFVPKVTNNSVDDALSKQVQSWEKESLDLIEKLRKQGKDERQAELKLKKLLNNYEMKLSKSVKDKRKLISVDLSKVSLKIAELKKKEDFFADKQKKLEDSFNSVQKKQNEVTSARQKKQEEDFIARQKKQVDAFNILQKKQEEEFNAREKKLTDYEKTLQDRKKELDLLGAKDQDLAKRKSDVENEVIKYKRILSEIRADMFNAKKSFDYEKKELSVQRRDIQANFRKFQEMIESEKQKGDAKLSDLAAKINAAEAVLNSTTNKVQTITAQLKSRELAVLSKEKKVLNLLEQEKKMLVVLRGTSKIPHAAEDDYFQKKQLVEQKAVKIIQEKGEPQIFIDDEDALNQKIQDCKDLLKEENYEDAKLLYNELREAITSAKIEEEKKKLVKHEIRELYDEICIGIIAPRNQN